MLLQDGRFLEHPLRVHTIQGDVEFPPVAEIEGACLSAAAPPPQQRPKGLKVVEHGAGAVLVHDRFAQQMPVLA
jgi:hypothetical protein